MPQEQPLQCGLSSFQLNFANPLVEVSYALICSLKLDPLLQIHFSGSAQFAKY